MRSRNFVVTAALGAALALFGSEAEAQLRPWEISIAGGPSFTTGDFSDVANTGYNVQGSIGFGIPLFPVGVRADLLWQEMPDEISGNYRQIGGIANVTLGMPLIIIEPYVLAGVGMFSLQEPDEVHVGHDHPADSETSTGFNVGAGLEAGMLGLKGFAEVRYLDMGHGQRTIPVTVGIRF